ncbi:MAG: tRNA (adenosine(37)-N6)-threonylcarbamoyltransferase complex dimerization subunit type 1 TsaB [Bryobacteraceae bacterium]
MPRIISLDATSEFGSLALIEDGRVVEETPMHSTDGFGHVLFDMLAGVLARHGWNALDADCYAAAAGPGSFTGVRVGLAAAKGLAEAASKPLITVSNLKAVAWFGTAPLRAAVLDARRGEIYGAVFNETLETVRDEVVMKLPAWLEALPDGQLEFLSPDPSRFRSALAATRFASATFTATPRAVAGAIGMISHGMFLAGCAPDPAAAEAEYVRRSDAELMWKETL